MTNDTNAATALGKLLSSMPDNTWFGLESEFLERLSAVMTYMVDRGDGAAVRMVDVVLAARVAEQMIQQSSATLRAALLHLCDQADRLSADSASNQRGWVEADAIRAVIAAAERSTAGGA